MERMRRYALARKARMILGVLGGTAMAVAYPLGIRQEYYHSNSMTETKVFLGLAIVSLASVIAISVIQHFIITPVQEALYQESREKLAEEIDATIKRHRDEARALGVEIERLKAVEAALRRHERTPPHKRPKA